MQWDTIDFIYWYWYHILRPDHISLCLCSANMKKVVLVLLQGLEIGIPLWNWSITQSPWCDISRMSGSSVRNLKLYFSVRTATCTLSNVDAIFSITVYTVFQNLVIGMNKNYNNISILNRISVFVFSRYKEWYRLNHN